MKKSNEPSSQAVFGQIVSLKISIVNAIGPLGLQANEAWRNKDRPRAEALELKITELTQAAINLHQIEISIRNSNSLSLQTAKLKTISKDARRAVKTINQVKNALKGAQELVELVTSLTRLFL